MVNRDGYYKAITDAELREIGHLPALEKAPTTAPEVYDMSMEDREDIPGYDIAEENEPDYKAY